MRVVSMETGHVHKDNRTQTASDSREGGGRSQRTGRIHAKFFFRKLMSPLVDESWELMVESSCSSSSIFLASCFPSSTLQEETGSY